MLSYPMLFGVVGILFMCGGVLKRNDWLFLISGILLLIYSIFLGDLVFIVLEIIFIGITIFGYIKRKRVSKARRKELLEDICNLEDLYERLKNSHLLEDQDLGVLTLNYVIKDKRAELNK